MCVYILTSSSSVTVIIEQLPLLLGTSEPPFKKPVYQELVHDISILTEAHLPTLYLGMAGLVFLLLLRVLRHAKFFLWAKYIPSILILIVATTALSFELDFEKLGIATIPHLEFQFPNPR